ncbi:hypothetical protein L512_5222 [Bordetella bronchiseptica MBORD624]|uniref:hypothetical protein n=1 Tax=Bordetella bronchiseptica TaxID=518 RepID=UPI00046164B9|nr:hypothetical protein [Bordetella bronchiseptica]KDC59345.1 hypothetical protein L511_4155 [Bordetella bronchiseptica MBORD595]KDC67995.1 hypothetical protein L512_5222 [Bordetella bronchiseptica MBORD624]
MRLEYDPMNQVHPGPMEGIDRIPDDATQARTGNTEREQEMYAAGIEVGEANTKHNAAIRAAAGWKLVEALRDSLLWTASSLAAVGKEQNVITLEGRKRTIGEILDEANAALDAPSPDCAAPGSPASAAPGDAPDDRLYQWPTTTARMKALAAELIFAANSMGGGGNDGEDVELVLSVAPAGTILLDEDPDVWNPGSLLTVHTKEYPDAGRYLVDPAQVSSDGTQFPAPTAGEAPPRFTISASDRFELTGAVGLLRGCGYVGPANALQRVLDAESASFSVQGEDDARDAGRYRWLCDKFGITKLPCAIERIIEGTYVADGKDGIDAAIDAAIAAQQHKGDE